jgi:hypothetical protein
VERISRKGFRGTEFDDMFVDGFRGSDLADGSLERSIEGVEGRSCRVRETDFEDAPLEGSGGLDCAI